MVFKTPLDLVSYYPILINFLNTTLFHFQPLQTQVKQIMSHERRGTIMVFTLNLDSVIYFFFYLSILLLIN